jgi:predicted 3-demethylubiquinone-9 3-methyltransferase (glyoxalase superfamily)
MSNHIRTCLWFRDGRGHEAAEFYCSLIPGSRADVHIDRIGIDFGLD